MPANVLDAGGPEGRSGQALPLRHLRRTEIVSARKRIAAATDIRLSVQASFAHTFTENIFMSAERNALTAALDYSHMLEKTILELKKELHTERHENSDLRRRIRKISSTIHEDEDCKAQTTREMMPMPETRPLHGGEDGRV